MIVNYYSIVRTGSSLSHHGIKGQRWGVRRFQNSDGSLTSAGRERYLKNFDLTSHSPEAKLARGVVAGLSIKRMFKEPKELSEAYRDRLPKLRDEKFLERYYRKHGMDLTDYERLDGDYEKLSDVRKKTDDQEDVMGDLSSVNPYRNHRGGVSNSFNCSVAMEMRRRGYDVVARGRTSKHLEPYDTRVLFSDEDWTYPNRDESMLRRDGESEKHYNKRTYEHFCDTIKKDGKESSGIVLMPWKGTTNYHSLYYQTRNGNVSFYDGQTGTADADHLFTMADPDRCSYVRLDNRPTVKGSTFYVVSRKEK